MAKTFTPPTFHSTFGWHRAGARLHVMWSDDKARYALSFAENQTHSEGAAKWLPSRTLGSVRIGKHAPLGLRRGNPGYFTSRTLDGDAAKYADIVRAATEYANSGKPEAEKAERDAKEEAAAQIEAVKNTEAHGAATKERLLAWASTMPNGPDMGRFRQVVNNLTNKEADRLSAYVHDLVR